MHAARRLLHRSDMNYLEAIKCYLNALRLDKDNVQILRDLAMLQVGCSRRRARQRCSRRRACRRRSSSGRRQLAWQRRRRKLLQAQLQSSPQVALQQYGQLPALRRGRCSRLGSCQRTPQLTRRCRRPGLPPLAFAVPCAFAANPQIQMRDLSGFVDTRHRLLQLRSNNRNNWISFAVAHHLDGNYELAVQILAAYESTLVSRIDAAD